MGKKSTYIYGKDPNPASWHTTADIIKSNSPKKVKDADKKPTK